MIHHALKKASGIPVLAAALMVLPKAQAVEFTTFDNYFSLVYGDGTIPDDIPQTTGQQISPDGRTIKLYGECGPIPGSRFNNGFVLESAGPVTGLINAGDIFTVDLDFDVTVTGGVLAWSYYGELRPSEGETARILTDLIPIPASGHVSGVHLESSPFTQPGEAAYYQSYLHVDWTGYSPTDTITLTIPQHSVDITYVPEPTSAALLLLASSSLCVRIRRLEVPI